jgi:hypothetical protein
MTATEQNLSMNEGETKKIVVTQTDDEDSGGDLNISGFNELTWVLKTRQGGEVIVEKTESGSSDVTVTDASVGAYEITIQPTDTEGILNRPEDTFFHKVRLEDSGGNISDLLQGTVRISEA